jgi:hypothetical protein
MKLTFFVIAAAICSGSAAHADVGRISCATLLNDRIHRVSDIWEREFQDALQAWSLRPDLNLEEVVKAEFFAGFGRFRQPVLLIRTGQRLFILNKVGDQVQIRPKTRETIARSYMLVGEGSLSPHTAGQVYEFHNGKNPIRIEIYKTRTHHLSVQASGV